MKVNEIERRPAEYLNDSGIPALSGFAFVALGISQLLWPALVKAHPDLAVAVQWAGLVCAWVAIWMIARFKRRFVFPRTGYAVPRRHVSFKVIRVVAPVGVVVVALLFRAGYRSPDLAGRFAAPVFCVLFAAIAGLTAHAKKSRLGYWFAAYIISLGIVLWWIRPLGGISWMQIGIGAPLGVYGAIRLRQFLRASPVEVDDEHR